MHQVPDWVGQMGRGIHWGSDKQGKGRAAWVVQERGGWCVEFRSTPQLCRVWGGGGLFDPLRPTITPTLGQLWPGIFSRTGYRRTPAMLQCYPSRNRNGSRDSRAADSPVGELLGAVDRQTQRRKDKLHKIFLASDPLPPAGQVFFVFPRISVVV